MKKGARDDNTGFFVPKMLRNMENIFASIHPLFLSLPFRIPASLNDAIIGIFFSHETIDTFCRITN